MHTKLTPINVECRRWFQRSYGNTYHSATVYWDDGSVSSSGREYGYGEQCLQTALRVMREHGGMAIPDRVCPSLYIREELGIPYTVTDVSRERDL